MESIIRELYEQFCRDNPELETPLSDPLLGEATDLQDEIEMALPKEMRPKVEKCIQLYMQGDEAQREEAFIAGFKLGARIIMAVKDKEDEEKPEK